MLAIRPRAQRTVWETADGRLVFTRYRQGWMIRNSAIAQGGLKEDRSLLRDMGVISDWGDNDDVFETLAQARSAVRMMYQGHPNPPSDRLRQRPISYEVDGAPFFIRRSGRKWACGVNSQDVWKAFVPEENMTDSSIHPSLYRGKLETVINQICAPCFTMKYPTRSAALRALEYHWPFVQKKMNKLYPSLLVV